MYPEDERPVKRQFPKVPPDRRTYAFLIDFVTVWLISSFFTNGFVQALVFLISWFALRVVVVEKNSGQSLGSWFMDIKVLDLRFRRIPGIQELTKREGIVAIEALLTMVGFNLAFQSFLSTLLLACPLLVDAAIAFADEEYQQSLHDKLAGTVMIQTRRGFSLDLRVKELLDEIKSKMRK